MDALWLVLASAAGACIASQAAANGALRMRLDDPRYAAFFSICGTFATALIVMAALRPPAPSVATIRSAAWWTWIGGPLGALFVLSGATLAPRLGAATYISAVVAGQLACSLVLDHFGLMNVPRQGLSVGRLVGALLVFAGMLLVKFR